MARITETMVGRASVESCHWSCRIVAPADNFDRTGGIHAAASYPRLGQESGKRVRLIERGLSVCSFKGNTNANH